MGTLKDGATNLGHIFGPSDQANLNLTTCAGAWDENAKRYSDRLVVFTRFESEQPLLSH